MARTIEDIIPAAALRDHIAAVGKTGSGKTSVEKAIIEHVVDLGHRVCVLDSIKSDWWGITSSSNGKKPGLSFTILGGPRGHLPLTSSAGKAIGTLVGQGKLPLSIIDMADFEAGGLQRFFVDFAPALLRAMKGVVYLVLEEAHEFAPKERAGFGAENMAIHWAKKLATAGRSKGIRIILATQRVQSLHNALLGSAETLIALRLTTPADQKPVIDWLKANVPDKQKQAEIGGTLSSLKTGSGWLCSGEAGVFEREQFPMFRTYDNHATPTGDGKADAITMAAVDRDEIKAIIGDALAEAEANDPKLLRDQIAKLQRELAAKPTDTGKALADEITMVADAAHSEGYAKGVNDGAARATAVWMNRITDLRSEVDRALAGAASNVPAIEAGAAPVLQSIIVPTKQQVAAHTWLKNGDNRAHTAAPTRPSVTAAPSDKPLGAERNPLAALVRVYPSGMTEAQWAVAAGLKRKGGTWGTYKSRLASAGRIERRGDQYFATEQGVADLGNTPDPMPPPGPELVDYWAGKISGVRPMLEHLRRVYPAAITRDQLADGIDLAAGGGTFGTYLSRLRGPGLIEMRGGLVRLSPSLMER